MRAARVRIEPVLLKKRKKEKRNILSERHKIRQNVRMCVYIYMYIYVYVYSYIYSYIKLYQESVIRSPASV